MDRQASDQRVPSAALMNRLQVFLIGAVALATMATGTLTACGGAGAYPTSQRPGPRPTGTSSSWTGRSSDGRSGARSTARSTDRPATRSAATDGPKVEQRYGLWVGAIDALATTVYFGSILAEEDDGRDTAGSVYLRVSGLLGYAFVTPIMHRVYGNGWGASASFLMRTTLPLATTVMAELGYGCGSEINSSCKLAAPIGLAIGATLTTVIDALYLAKRRVPASSVRGASRPGRLRIAPLAIVTGERRMLGLGGRF